MDGPGIENQEDALYALMLVNRRGLQIIWGYTIDNSDNALNLWATALH